MPESALIQILRISSKLFFIITLLNTHFNRNQTQTNIEISYKITKSQHDIKCS